MIEVANLYKRYGNFVAVKDVSFKINEGEILGFLGPNGAGKSTTMNIITGYLSPTSGKVGVGGFDIIENPNEVKSRIGYLPEQPPLYMDMTVREYLYFIFDLKKINIPRTPHIEEICRLVKIDDVCDRLIKNLSKGYRQRVGIAQALVGNPAVLILDEPTVGLDPKQIIEIRNLIKQLGKTHTVILSSHILSEVQAVCERIIIINKGEIVADGTPEQLADNLSHKDITVRVIGDREEIASAINAVDGVKEISQIKSVEPGSLDFVVEPTDSADIRAELLNTLGKKGFQVLELWCKNMSLEEIYLSLVGEKNSDSENKSECYTDQSEPKCFVKSEENSEDACESDTQEEQ
ncbi:MAG: ABC transporter ATP-binding protein [bacterium]|nr:ABC transporter ATP-binding protein [bacterium]